MADQAESNPVGDGAVAEGQPQPTSTPSGVQQTSIDADAIAEFFETDRGKEILDRRAQSIKDRRFAEQEKQLSGIRETLERLDSKMKEQGLSREQAIYQIDLEDRLKALEGNPVVTTSEPETQAKAEPAPTINVEPLLKAVDIDPNDPRVKEFYKTDASKTAQGVLNFISSIKLKQTATPSPAQSMPTGGGHTPAQRDEAVVREELRNVMNTVPLDAQKMRDLRLELQSITNK